MFPYKYQSDPVLIRMITTKAAKEGAGRKWITGMTILDNELFVAIEKREQIEVYDSTELSFSHRMNLRELFNPLDIGSCNIKKCLYIFDAKDDHQSPEILRVDPSGKLIKNWSSAGDYYSRLSVTDESNIILVVHSTKKLNEYSLDGQLIRQINLPSDMHSDPMHAVKLTNGHFVVCHEGHGVGYVLWMQTETY